MTISGEQLEGLYTTMVKIRRFDEKTVELFHAGLVKGTAHSYVGEEAVAAGACATLREGAYFGGTQRGHGHLWAPAVIRQSENNRDALSPAPARTTAGESIAARAAAYAIPGVRVDGNDALAVYEAVGAAVARARRGEGPTLLEAVTYRWGGHSMRANLPEYRTKEEEREWMERDPIARLRNRLVDEKRATPMRLKELEEP